MHTYPEICQNTIRRIKEGRETIYVNTYYKHSRGFIWCINSKGYYHIYKPEKINTNVGGFPGMDLGVAQDPPEHRGMRRLQHLP